MDGLFQRKRFSFFAFVHLLYKQTYRFICQFVNLLSDGADGKYGFSGYGGVIKTYNQPIVWQAAVSAYQKIEKNVGMGVVGYKNPLLLTGIVGGQILQGGKKHRLSYLVGMAQFS